MAIGKRTRSVELDLAICEAHRQRLGFTIEKLALEADLARGTVSGALNGKRIDLFSASRIANCFGIEDVREILLGCASYQHSEEADQEWKEVECLGPWETASNGLQYRLYKMEHQYIEKRMGRGKCYDLQGPSNRDSKEARKYLVRHATVCSQIGPHRLLADNLATYPDSQQRCWWVIDRWIEGETLEEKLKQGTWNPENTPRLACEVAAALSVLHKSGIIFRELGPSHILITDDDGRCVLTGFELAKIVETAPTVSTDWPEDPYRAPEVECGNVNVQADLYSWAMVVLNAAAPSKSVSRSTDALKEVEFLPKSVLELISKSLSARPSQRPKDISKVVATLKKTWPEWF